MPHSNANYNHKHIITRKKQLIPTSSAPNGPKGGIENYFNSPKNKNKINYLEMGTRRGQSHLLVDIHSQSCEGTESLLQVGGIWRHLTTGAGRETRAILIYPSRPRGRGATAHSPLATPINQLSINPDTRAIIKSLNPIRHERGGRNQDVASITSGPVFERGELWIFTRKYVFS